MDTWSADFVLLGSLVVGGAQVAMLMRSNNEVSLRGIHPDEERNGYDGRPSDSRSTAQSACIAAGVRTTCGLPPIPQPQSVDEADSESFATYSPVAAEWKRAVNFGPSSAVRACDGPRSSEEKSPPTATRNSWRTILMFATPSLEIISQVICNLQYLELLSYMITEMSRACAPLDVVAPWSRELKSDGSLGWLALFNMDAEQLYEYSPTMWTALHLPWVTIQFVITILLPLSIGLCTVVVVKPLQSIVWLLALIASLVALAIGIFSEYSITKESSLVTVETRSLLDSMLVVGAVGLSSCFLVYVGHLVTGLLADRRLLKGEVERLGRKSDEVAGGASRRTYSRRSTRNLYSQAVSKATVDELLHSLRNAVARRRRRQNRTLPATPGGKELEAMDDFNSFLKALTVFAIMATGAGLFWLQAAGRLSLSLSAELARSLAIAATVIFSLMLAQLIVLQALRCFFHVATIESAAQIARALFLRCMLVLVGLVYMPLMKQTFSVAACVSSACARGSWYPRESPSADLSLIFRSIGSIAVFNASLSVGAAAGCEGALLRANA